MKNRLSRVALLVLLLTCAGATLAQPEAAPVNPVPAAEGAPQVRHPGRGDDPSRQVEFDLQRLAEALNARRFGAALKYVADARSGWFGGQEWLRYWRADLQIDAVQVSKLAGDNAEATVTYRVHRRDFSRDAHDKMLYENDGWPVYQPAPRETAARRAYFAEAPARRETLRLRRRAPGPLNGDNDPTPLWGIVVGDLDQELRRDQESLNRIAIFIKQPPGILPRLRAEESVSRLRQLALGVFQLAVDWDNRYPFEAEFAPEAIVEYVQHPGVFTVPGTTRKYSFNARLGGHGTALADRAHTVLFYEGDDEKPTPRYNGLAAVGLCDGSVALLGPEEIKNLKWDPQAPR